MNRRNGETETRRPDEFLSRAKRVLEWCGSTSLSLPAAKLWKSKGQFAIE
ncbi:MAG TPA: hypothetical protein VHT01_06930 [Candidatus Udaeobacter sp.]|nr:hypothetical protein [Candidatus Udaeobacter sp.]